MPLMLYSTLTLPLSLSLHVLKIFLVSRSLTNWTAESIMRDELPSLLHLPVAL